MKASKNKIVEALDLMLAKMEQIDNSSDPAVQARLRQEVLELDYATKTSGDPRTIKIVADYTKSVFTDWYLPTHKSGIPEANNLEATSSNDLSRANPKNSFFWKNPGNIASLNVEEMLIGSKMPMHKDVKIKFPAQNVFRFEEVKKRQTTPKLSVRVTDDDGTELKYTFKWGKETHADPTVSSLLATLGFSTDAVKHVENVKIYLGNTTRESFRKEFTSYFKVDNWELPFDLKQMEDAKFITYGRDAGGEYLFFQEGLLEADPKELVRLGGWGFNSSGHDQWREPRALMVFNMWIQNVDAQEDQNNKVVLRKLGKKEFEMHLSQHDSSFALGLLLSEHVDAFPLHMIKNLDEIRSGRASQMAMTMKSVRQNPLAGKISYADAKWMARLIGQLTQAQIEAAVRLGHWPTVTGPKGTVDTGRVLAEKLISRRNDLVLAFGLDKEGYTVIETETDKQILTEAAMLKGSAPVGNQKYGDYDTEVTNPVKNVLKSAAKSGLKYGIGSVSNIYKNSDAEYGIRAGAVFEVVANANRKYRANPRPNDGTDNYLVEDTVRVGGRLGGGFLVTGDVSRIWQYRLVWPAASETEALGKGLNVVDFSLPFEALKNKLPPKFVLIREEFLEGAGRINTPRSNGIDIGFDGKASRVSLTRSIIDAKGGDKVIMHEDFSTYYDLQYRALIEVLGIMSIPVVTQDLQKEGKLNGRTFIIARNEATSDSALNDAMTDVITRGNFEKLAGMKTPLQTDASFKGSSFNVNLLGLYKYESKMSSEQTKIVDGATERVISDSNRHRSLQSSNWSILDNGETHEVRIQAFGPNSKVSDLESSKKDASTLRLSYQITDIDARPDEIDLGSIKMANTLALRDDFLAFRATENTNNGLFGRVNTYVDVQYCSDAIGELMTLDKEKFWRNVGAIMAKAYPESKINADNIYNARQEFLTRMGQGPKGARINLKVTGDAIIQHGVWFLGALEDAKKATTNYARLEKLTKALKRAQFKTVYTFSPVIMAALNKGLADKQINYFVHAELSPPAGVQSPFPGGIIPRNQQGAGCAVSDESIMLFPADAVEIYNMFSLSKDRVSSSIKVDTK